MLWLIYTADDNDVGLVLARQVFTIFLQPDDGFQRRAKYRKENKLTTTNRPTIYLIKNNINNNYDSNAPLLYSQGITTSKCFK